MTTRLAQCTYNGCLNAQATDGASRPEDAALCERHRQIDRNRRGVCPNCAGELEQVAVVNPLTGEQRKDLARQPVWHLVCSGCGYKRRPRA